MVLKVHEVVYLFLKFTMRWHMSLRATFIPLGACALTL